ncbi:ABC transporter substrate-binding protein [Paludibacterium sp. B53371]|uniref:substrate-binding periplasmic protein n=1 Tax=Paludibacterium sp. B53371 TaxID=2806263 RepID=UPI001C0468F9|nr:transporter substrate-binding domain-containing protein [Paludibacterium sp. B53371]
MRLLTRLIMWLSLLTLAMSCRAEQPEISIVLSNQEYPPYMGQSMAGDGLMSRVVSEAFRLQNVKVRYVFYPNNRTLQSARTGAVDGSLGWAITPERQKDLLYTDPVMSLRMVFFQRADHPVAWKHMRDLASRRIGITSGNTYSEEFSRLQAAGVLHPEASPDDVSNLRKLQAGHLDLFPIDSEVGALLMVQNFRPDQRAQVVAQPEPFWTAPMHVVIWRRHPLGAELVRRFNLGLKQLHASGKFNQLVEETRNEIYLSLDHN